MLEQSLKNLDFTETRRIKSLHFLSIFGPSLPPETKHIVQNKNFSKFCSLRYNKKHHLKAREGLKNLAIIEKNKNKKNKTTPAQRVSRNSQLAHLRTIYSNFLSAQFKHLTICCTWRNPLFWVGTKEPKLRTKLVLIVIPLRYKGFFKNWIFYEKETDPKFAFLVQFWPFPIPHYPLKMAKVVKNE